MRSVPDPLQPHINHARGIRDNVRNSHGTVIEIAHDSDPRTERGRLMAAHNIRTMPETRKLMESVYGKEYCKRRYPEAYQKAKR